MNSLETFQRNKEQELFETAFDVGWCSVPRQREDGTDDQNCDSYFVDVQKRRAGVFDAARKGHTQRLAGKLGRWGQMRALNTIPANPTARQAVRELQNGWQYAESAIKLYHDNPGAHFRNIEAMDMASTATIFQLVSKENKTEPSHREMAVVLHAGDTKFLASYSTPDGPVIQQTRDQAYIYHMEQKGNLTQEQATVIEDLVSNGITTAHFKDYVVLPDGRAYLPRSKEERLNLIYIGGVLVEPFWNRRQYLENCLFDNRLYVKPGEEKVGEAETYRFDVSDAEFFVLYSDGIGDNFMQKELLAIIRGKIAEGWSSQKISTYVCQLARQNAADPNSDRAVRDDMTFILWIPKRKKIPSQPKIPA